MDLWVTCFLWYCAILVWYHLSEFVIQYVYNRDQVTWDTFLITTPYLIAMGSCILEYFVELYFFPSLKNTHTYLFYVGLTWTLVGEFLRKLAMITAKQSFTHQIQYAKRREHALVKHGIYAYVRHPGYLGWFLWSTGTQVLLANPVNFVLFTAWSWYFFYDRIPGEEEALIKMFGDEYKQYRSNTPTYIPFIK